jgi:predicted lipid-binding transport protein (Tim44 family)
MPYCSRCGNQVTDEMSFCNRCGAALKPGVAPPVAPPRPAPPPPERYEKYEKREKEAEKREKGEKGEKHEKEATGYMGPVIGGLILILLGFMFYLMTLGMVRAAHVWPIFLLIVGVIIIVFGVYAATTARRRSPRP